ncbi:MAG: hypothetical protein OXT09_08315, partial [Myxococcales bacterium]|nr:hypothetical protein [Myxococcales bacterium]
TNKHHRDAARELLLAKAQALHAQASAAAAQITANNTLGRDIDAASKTIDQLQGTIVMTLQELDRLLKQTNQ